MATAHHKTSAGERLRELLPDGSDPYLTIDLAGHVAFLVRDRQTGPELTEIVKAFPELAAGLIVALAAMVDVDARPGDLLDWLGTHKGLHYDTIRTAAALNEARQEVDDTASDTLPPVTLETMRAMRHNAELMGVWHPCGTLAAHSRHVRNKERPCVRCTTARWLYDNATPDQRKLLTRPLDGYGKVGDLDRKPPTWRSRCGERAGYVAHKKANEEPCDDCYAALRRRSLDLYDERLARQGRVRQPVTAAPPEPRILELAAQVAAQAA
jgi:hypothetical protein